LSLSIVGEIATSGGFQHRQYEVLPRAYKHQIKYKYKLPIYLLVVPWVSCFACLHVQPRGAGLCPLSRQPLLAAEIKETRPSALCGTARYCSWFVLHMMCSEIWSQGGNGSHYLNRTTKNKK
ncbi:hypothetical protein XENORESO_015825, partial [Xenotaenia resolanae]